MPAFAAGFAFVALGLGLGASVGGHCASIDACVRTVLAADEREVLLLELLGGREPVFGLGLERGRAGDFRAGLAAAEGGDVPPTPTLSREGGGWGGRGRRTSCQNRKLVRARARQALGDVPCRGGGSAGFAFLHALAERVEATFGRIDMGEVKSLEGDHRELAEHVVAERGGALAL